MWPMGLLLRFEIYLGKMRILFWEIMETYSQHQRSFEFNQRLHFTVLGMESGEYAPHPNSPPT